ncbi:MAG: sensor histidine kinase [Micromonosporaceae bacterium]
MREPSTPPTNPGRRTAAKSRAQHARGARDSVNTQPDGRRMVFVAMLPAAVVTLIAVVLVGLIAYTSGATLEDIDQPIGLALIAGVLLAFAVLTWGWSVASIEVRGATNRTAALRRSASRSKAELAAAREELAQLETELESVKRESASALRSAAVDAARARHDGHVDIGDPAGRELQVEVFVNLARRLQSLVHRGIGALDELENEVEDPDLLKGLFQVDHLATRIRRHTENLAVLGGAVPHRQWTRPVSVSDVLRSAMAEIEHYSRVKLVPPAPGTIRGHAVADLVHLVAELAENATMFSPPHSQVLLRVEQVTAGLAIEVEDRGLGMPKDERGQMNVLLASPEQAVPAELLQDGRIGLYVVSSLARRHGIAVQLQGNIYGGTQAVLVLPHTMLGELPEEHEPKALVSSEAPPRAAQPAESLPRHGAASPRPRGRATVPRSAETAPRSPEHEELDRETSGSPSAHRPDGAVATQARRASHSREAPTHDVETSAHHVVPSASTRRSQAPEGPRPALPRRRRQEHMAPELLEPSQGAGRLDEVEHNPQLMATFQAGFRMGEEFSELDKSVDPDWDPQGRNQ